MPLLPIPACVEGFITGQELREGVIIICIIIILLSILPPIIFALLCGTEIAFDTSHPAHFGTAFVVVLAIIVLLILLLWEDCPGIVHFILIILWLLATISIVYYAVDMILTIMRFHDGIGYLLKSSCGIAYLIGLICFILLAIVMVYGLICYWSFYAEND
uniref:Uncharacterized protein n=1 Tax=Cacopsylla melanoneura TaxID=428564 RepID=A0A8D9B4S4_9HEMI